MVLQAYGLVDCAPIQISLTLKRLHMSHTVLGWKSQQLEVDGLTREQPVWPVVIDGIKNVNRVQTPHDRCVYFVCDGRAALNYANLSRALWPENRPHALVESIKQSLIQATTNPIDWKLEVNEPNIVEYVKVAVKPSFINHIQAIVQKITPYAKSKETRLVCIAYLAGGVGIQALRRYLKSSLKFSDLLVLMDSDAALNMRNAVAALKTKSIETVTEEFGVESFELMYIVKSYHQHKGELK